MSYLFSDPGYLSINDPYVKEKKKKGDSLKPFLTSPSKKGFPYQNFKTLAENEPYHDPGFNERQNAKEKRAKIQTVFRPSSPPKKTSGSGSYFGTLGPKYEHMVEYNVVKKGDKPSTPGPSPKNILTSTPKKGTYGYPHLGIGKDYSRLPNVVDDYDAIRKKQKKEHEESKALMRGSFRVGKTAHNEFFDHNPFRDIQTPSKPSTPKKEEKKTIVPFRPSSPPKFGGTIGKYPEYIPEPYEKKDSKKPDEKTNPVWRAVSNPKNGPTRSVLFGTK